MQQPECGVTTQVKSLLESHYGLNATDIAPVQGGRSHKALRAGPYFIKIYQTNRTSPMQLQHALDIADYLGEKGLPVPRVKRNHFGRRCTPCNADTIVISDFHAGQREHNPLTPEQASSFGATLGNIHWHLRNLPLPNHATPDRRNPRTIERRWRDLQQQASAIEPRRHFDVLVLEIASLVLETLPTTAPIPWNNFTWQWCHGDMHLNNLLFHDNQTVAAVLDFDQCKPWWAAFEILLAWHQVVCAEQPVPAPSPAAGEFFKAYQQHNSLPAEAWRMMPDLHLLAMCSTFHPLPSVYNEAVQPKRSWLTTLHTRLQTIRWLRNEKANMRDWILTATR